MKETAKFGGGSLMMWGCMLWVGVGYACKIDERMDGELYTKILEDEPQESLGFYGNDPLLRVREKCQGRVVECYGCNTKTTPVLRLLW